MSVEVFPTAEAVAAAAAEAFVALSNDAIKRSGRFSIALAGGSTPKHLYSLLATKAYAERIDWTRVHAYWGDERCVPPQDAQSNFRMASEALLTHVPIPADNIHRIHGEKEPEGAAATYERALRHSLAERFDLVLLGLGGDGHTASLFPGSELIHERNHWVAAEFVPAVGMWRVTLTPIVINGARTVMFLVAGAEKAHVLQRVLEGARLPELLPAQIIEPRDGELRWLVDAAATSRLTPI